VVTDSYSIDSIKKKLRKETGDEKAEIKLIEYFSRHFSEKKKYKKAISNFTKSLAAYSLICYIMAIKDRHNGNILIDIEGHILHIDFGFLLSNSPGGNMKFENVPFKLTSEFAEIMGGQGSKEFERFRHLMKDGFMALQEHADKIIMLVEMMILG